MCIDCLTHYILKYLSSLVYYTLNGDELTCDGGLKVLAVELYDGVVGVVQAAIHTLVDLKIRVADPSPNF